MKKLSLMKKLSAAPILWGAATAALAADAPNLSTIASGIGSQAQSMSFALTIVSYLAGVGFAMAGILQFKAHKDNPQQVPLSKPVVMVIVAACLVFLPTLINTAGTSVFGSAPSSAKDGDKSLGGNG